MRIEWEEWGEEAFRRAQREDKPVLLAISAVWCHWCHVMDETSYADEDVIRIISEKYVPVRVDNDRRPDINRRYNMGGWPTVALLTPEGDLITGATYLPPEELKNALLQVYDYYKEHRSEIKAQVEALEKQLASPPRLIEQPLREECISEVTNTILENFDAVYGGFGRAPKFPHADVLEFVLHEYQDSQDIALLNVVSITLDEMAGGSIFDHVEGGFFRYATLRDWSAPHYEKMLEDNAALLTLYLKAHVVTQNNRYRDTALKIVDYVESRLSGENCFYGSQDADENYYALSLEERRSTSPPHVDKTLYVNWNAQMCEAYLLASAVLRDGKYRDFALHVLDFINQHLRTHSGVYHHYSEGRAQVTGLLTDNLHLAKAMLTAHEATGENRFLKVSQELTDYILQNLWSEEHSAFVDRIPEEGSPGALRYPDISLIENSIAATHLLRLYWTTSITSQSRVAFGEGNAENEHYALTAKKILQRFQTDHQAYGINAAAYAGAMDLFLKPVLKLDVVTDLKRPGTQELIDACMRLIKPRKLIRILDVNKQADIIRKNHYLITEEPQIYVCQGTRCLSPVSTEQELIKLAAGL